MVNSRLGVEMTVPPFTAKLADGGDFFGELSISEVPEGLAPAALPDSLQPGLLITIQPVGVIFEPPVPITFPNVDGLDPESVVDIWSLDPDEGVFIIVAKGRVRSDGSAIDTTSGGIRAADWHFPLPVPLIADGSQNNSDNTKCSCPRVKKASTGSETSISKGSLSEEHELVGYSSLGVERAPILVYNSLSADPQPIISSDNSAPSGGARPITTSARLNVGGVDQGQEVFTTPPFLAGVTFRQAVQFDASNLETGLYPYELALTSHYSPSAITTRLCGERSGE